MIVNAYYDTFITITYNVNNEGGGSYRCPDDFVPWWLESWLFLYNGGRILCLITQSAVNVLDIEFVFWFFVFLWSNSQGKPLKKILK